MYRLSLLLLTLLPLALSQNIQTRVSCLADGQCITDLGENAVCGKVDSSAKAQLPVVTGSGEDYIIRIDLSAKLPDDPNPITEKPCPECPTNVSGRCEGINGRCSNNPTLFSSNDPRNPTLGGVGCPTPAFNRRCLLCCVQTSVLQKTRRERRRLGVRGARPVPRIDICEIDRQCSAPEIDDEEALGIASLIPRRDCFSNAPLGFYRTPTRRFFRICRRNAGRICPRGMRRCRDFAPQSFLPDGRLPDDNEIPLPTEDSELGPEDDRTPFPTDESEMGPEDDKTPFPTDDSEMGLEDDEVPSSTREPEVVVIDEQVPNDGPILGPIPVQE